jgi:hypothetical protein
MLENVFFIRKMNPISANQLSQIYHALKELKYSITSTFFKYFQKMKKNFNTVLIN